DSTDVAELRLQNAYQIAEGAALGAILKSVDAANFQLIDGKNSKEAWDVLFATHNKQNSSQQFQLFQELACTSQSANESLTAYHQCIELAADRLVKRSNSTTGEDKTWCNIYKHATSNMILELSTIEVKRRRTTQCNTPYASFTSGMTAKDVVDSTAAYFSLLGLEKDEFNDILNYHITLSGTVTCSAINTAYRTEQQHRYTANMVKESGLAARAGRPSSKGSKSVLIAIMLPALTVARRIWSRTASSSY
ncbi:hypothetical protein M407DRAFT_34349, partial [Tulasnella calospora MUT 4182]